MFAKFYNSPDGIKSNAELFIFATENLVSLEFTRCWSRAGEFTMVLPFDTAILRKLATGEIIDYGGNWFMIESLSYDYKRITLSGHDLGIVLSYRVSAYIPDAQEPGTQGYDTVWGTTAQCIEHYINNNFIAPADSERAVPMSFSSQSGAGVYNDRYMARLENVLDFTTKLCDDAGKDGIGFRTELLGGKIHINLEKSVDKSIDQSVRPRVIFSAERGNITAVSFEHGVNNLYNAVYATGADVTEIVYRDNSNIPQGLDRRECATDVSVESVEDIDYIRDYALKAVENNTETHSYEISVPAGDYGRIYELGDKVTIEEKILGNKYTAIITEAKFTYSAGREGVTITLGKQRPRILNRLINNVMNGTARRN